jgi:Skp family chaperone for outer membrane proteins
MKKTFLATLLLALAAATLAVAQEAGAPRVAKIAVIDMARVSAESQLGKAYAAQLEKLQSDINAAAQAKQTELEKMDAAIRELQDELQNQGGVLSAEARQNKEREIVRMGRDRQAYLEDGQVEINQMRDRAQQQAQSINNEFQVKIRPVVEEVAKSKGYDLVLDSQVAYTISRDFDITRDVISKADETLQPPAAGAAAAPPASSGPAAPSGPATPSGPPQ